MSELEDKTKQVSATSIDSIVKEKINFNIDDFDSIIKILDIEKYDYYKKGKVYQKNKDLKIIQAIIKSFINEINEIELDDKNTNNIILSKLNKKLIIEQLNGLHSLLTNINLKEDKLLYTLLGTMIQYIYEQYEKE